MEEEGQTKVGPKWDRKREFFRKLEDLLQEYPRVLVVHADNVSSNQMSQIRKALRNKAIVQMGKNTMMRRAIRAAANSNAKLEKLLPRIVGNIGLVFTKEEPDTIRQIINGCSVGAPAKAGSIAPIDVVVEKGPTGMEPGQTAFLQALNIATKISRGQIEILNDVHLVFKDQKVGASEAVLLEKLGIRPFSYALKVHAVYDDGVVYGVEILDMTADDVVKKFVDAAQAMGAISMQIGYPTVVSVPYSIRKAFGNIFNISMGTDFPISQTAEIKELLDNPELLAAAQAAAAEAAPAADEKGGDGGDGDGDGSGSGSGSSGSCGFGLFG